MQSIRWWPAGVILGGGLLWLSKVWFFGDIIRQLRVMQTIGTIIIGVLLLLLWWMFLSRLRWRTRLTGLGAVVIALGLCAAVFRVRGVTGDLVPILSFRWESDAGDRALPAPSFPHPAVDSSEALRKSGSTPPSLVPLIGETPVAPSMPRLSSSPRENKTEPPLATADYPEFLGPHRNGTIREPRLARDWSARSPRLVWRHPIGAGWSAFAIAGRSAVTQEQRGNEELVVSYDLATGQTRWAHSDQARYETVIAGVGPRATPTVSGNRVYSLGATGILNCLDFQTGRRIWVRDVLKDNDATNPDWGKSCSPLVSDGLAVVSAGGTNGKSLVAYHQETGELLWAAGSDQSGYSSPLIAELAGQRQILIFNRASIAAHDPVTGRLLWQHPWPAEQPNVAQPLPLPGDRLLVSSGYGIGSKLFQISKRADDALAATLLWETSRLKAKFTNLVFLDGYVYGLDDGVLTCLDPANGERRWKDGRYGHGQVILVANLLLVQTEEGEIVLVDPNPQAFRELARFAALEGKTWNPPALAGASLLVRNDREAACYELPLIQ